MPIARVDGPWHAGGVNVLRWLVGIDPRSEGEEPDVRFSFANERTFLAWNRTALALIGVGLAVANLLPPFRVAGGRRMVALPLILLGGYVSVRSLRDWAANERAIRTGRPLPRSSLAAVLSVAVGAVAVVAALLGAFATRP
jgi:putative membrane protein